MKIVIAGGNGFLGRALAKHFARLGREVVILTRRGATPGDTQRTVVWDACTPGAWTSELDGADVVINLAGRSVNCRYTPANRREILASRVQPTRLIGSAIAACKHPPSVWLNASTATIYKHTFGPAWTEAGTIGGTTEAKDQFSIEVATAWERALTECPTPHTRKIALRAAMVLGLDQNSVFPTLRKLTRCGLGGRMGNGKQFVSWIHVDDFCRAVEHLIRHEQFNGPINVCAPNPLSNEKMMQTFRDTCRMPIGLPATRWMLEAGAFFLRTETELILKSRHVVPGKLLAAGFNFSFPFFAQAIKDLENQTTLLCHAKL